MNDIVTITGLADAADVDVVFGGLKIPVYYSDDVPFGEFRILTRQSAEEIGRQISDAIWNVVDERQAANNDE